MTTEKEFIKKLSDVLPFLDHDYFNQSINEPHLFNVYFDSRHVILDILRNKDLSDEYYAELGKKFAHSIGQQYIERNAESLEEAILTREKEILERKKLKLKLKTAFISHKINSIAF